MQMSLKSLIFGFVVNSAIAGRDVIPFTHLQVSSPMDVEVVTDTSQSQVSLDIAADGMGLGWTVKASVEPMTFGRTLLLGMDERAARQGFHWPSSAAGKATLRVPQPLTEVSATGGAQVLVDVATNALLADSKSNLTVTKFVTPNENTTRFIMASSGANITVAGGFAGKAFVKVGTGCIVKLGCLVSEAQVEADEGAKLFINADQDTLNINAEDEEAVKIIKAEDEEAVKIIKAEDEEAVKIIKAEDEEAVKIIKAEDEEAVKIIKAEDEEAVKTIEAEDEEAVKTIEANNSEEEIDFASPEETEIEESPVIP